jgi:hypothetical protein
MREVADSMEVGGFLEGWARIAAYVGKGNAVDERPYRLMRRMIEGLPADVRPSLAEVKQALKHQFLLLVYDKERALATLPKLLPDADVRRRVFVAVQELMAVGAPMSDERKRRLERIETILGYTTAGAPKAKSKAKPKAKIKTETRPKAKLKTKTNAKAKPRAKPKKPRR